MIVTEVVIVTARWFLRGAKGQGRRLDRRPRAPKIPLANAGSRRQYWYYCYYYHYYYHYHYHYYHHHHHHYYYHIMSVMISIDRTLRARRTGPCPAHRMAQQLLFTFTSGRGRGSIRVFNITC